MFTQQRGKQILQLAVAKEMLFQRRQLLACGLGFSQDGIGVVAFGLGHADGFGQLVLFILEFLQLRLLRTLGFVKLQDLCGLRLKPALHHTFVKGLRVLAYPFDIVHRSSSQFGRKSGSSLHKAGTAE